MRECLYYGATANDTVQKKKRLDFTFCAGVL